MIKIIFIAFKVSVIVVLILVLGQITVGEKSISNHVHDFVAHPKVQAPVRWIAARIDHTAGHVPTEQDLENKKNDLQKRNNSNGQERLSGLLKRSHH